MVFTDFRFFFGSSSSLETRFATDSVSGAMAAAARRSACATDSVSGAMAAAARRSACVSPPATLSRP